jgi:hypothetical protein
MMSDSQCSISPIFAGVSPHITSLYRQFGTNRSLSELPSNLVLKKASPKLWLPFLTAIWGIITMCLGFVQNYAGFVAVRALLGIAEGGLLPGMVCFFLYG